MYVATINVPGYLPMDDEPPTFDTAADAWDYLADERMRGEDDTETPGDEYTETVRHLEHWAQAARTGESFASADGSAHYWAHGLGTVYGPTPGYDGEHDLGLAYSVSIAEED